MRTYEEGWPQSFNKPLKNPTVTMSASRTNVIVGDVGVFNFLQSIVHTEGPRH